MLRHLGWVSLCAAALALALAALQAEPAVPAGDQLFTIAQQTAYQVDPIKVRLVGREDFRVHRLEVVAKVPAEYAKPFPKDQPPPKDTAVPAEPNGKLTAFGKCTDATGLWHWDDCAHYEDTFAMDVRVNGRYEYDPSGLGRPGYVIYALKDGALTSPDADGKVFFFNGPPTAAPGSHSTDCPYRLVINTKGQNEVVQGLSMEPIYKVPGGGR